MTSDCTVDVTNIQQRVKVLNEEKQIELIWRQSDSGLEVKEVVSAFDVSSHADYVFRIGELVVFSPNIKNGAGDNNSGQSIGIIKDITNQEKVKIIIFGCG